jgi:hypothetical protein
LEQERKEKLKRTLVLKTNQLNLITDKADANTRNKIQPKQS